MKKIHFGLIISVLLFASCQKKEIKRESILDKISHVEDSLYYRIDSLPMLCDELDMRGKMINIGDCELYVEQQGEGIPMVVINGGPGGTHHCFHPWFSKAAKFSKVIYYDQRGCGQSGYCEGDGYTFCQAVNDLDLLRQKLGIDKWILCGYSYGGALAQFYAATYPENVKGMVLIGSVTLLDSGMSGNTRQQDYISDEERQKISEIYALYGAKKLTPFQFLYNKTLNGDWKRQHFYKPTKEEAIRAALYEWKHDNGFNRKVGDDYTRYSFKGFFFDSPVPTLICEGKWDLTWGEEKREVFRKSQPNAQYAFFENSGHSIFSEEPDLFFSTLKDFMKSIKDVPMDKILNWKKVVTEKIDDQEAVFEIQNRFLEILMKQEDVDKAYDYFHTYDYVNRIPLFPEDGMNNLGYDYMGKKDYQLAIKIFEMNIKTYPQSYNVYDSMGEAYMIMGDKENAKKYYEKSVEINPDNQSGVDALKKLGK